MTSTPPSPCLGEREAVARTIRKAMRGTCTSEGAADIVMSGLIEPLQAENETLRAERDAAQTEVTKLCYRVAQMHQDWAKEGIEWLRSSEIDRLQGAEARAMTAEAERDAARELAYELKLAAAGGEDVPGSAHAITVEDVARWHDEAWTRTAALDRDAAKARRALALTLRFVDRAAGEGITFLEGDNGEPAQDAADVCFAVADIFAIEDLDSDEFRALTTPEPPHGD